MCSECSGAPQVSNLEIANRKESVSKEIDEGHRNIIRQLSETDYPAEGGKLIEDTEFTRESRALDKSIEILDSEMVELYGLIQPILADNYPIESDEAAERGVESEVARQLQSKRHRVEGLISSVRNIKSRVRV